MGKLIQFPKGGKKNNIEMSDEGLNRLLEALADMPTDEQEQLLLVKQFAELQKEAINAMQGQQYEKFFYIKLCIEAIFNGIAEKHYENPPDFD